MAETSHHLVSELSIELLKAKLWINVDTRSWGGEVGREGVDLFFSQEKCLVCFPVG